jgi:hypothetical protein
MTGGGSDAPTGGLGAELARRTAAEVRMATSLVELEQHPGHGLLSAGPLTGRTAQEWERACADLAGLWQDFGSYQRVLADARDVLARAGEDTAELHRLLHEPSVEVGRSVVGHRLTGAVERIETITLAELADRMEAAFDRVHDLFVSCHDLHEAFLAALAPVAERLRTARQLAAELGDHGVADVTDRVEELTGRYATDPLSLADRPPADVLAELGGRVDALADELARIVAVRGSWDDRVTAVAAAIAEVEAARAIEEQVRLRAQELVVTAPLDPPPDRLPALRRELATLRDQKGWDVRVRALAELETAVDAAAEEVRGAHALADGLLERRTELRGRFEAYRAKAGRLGLAERPDLLALDADVRRLLWTRPADLAAATRALVSYQRRLLMAGVGDGATPGHGVPGRRA